MSGELPTMTEFLAYQDSETELILQPFWKRAPPVVGILAAAAGFACLLMAAAGAVPPVRGAVVAGACFAGAVAAGALDVLLPFVVPAVRRGVEDGLGRE